MIQTIVMVIVLLVVAAIVQYNQGAIHATTPLGIPGAASLPVSYLRLLAGAAAGAVVVWLAGLLDLGVLGARLRRREAAFRATEQELTRVKAVAYDKQEPVLSDVRSRLEEIVQEMAATLARVETVMRRGVGRGPAPVGEPAPVDVNRTVPQDVVDTPGGQITRRSEVVDTPSGPVVERAEIVDTPGSAEVRREAAAARADGREEGARRKRWPF